MPTCKWCGKIKAKHNCLKDPTEGRAELIVVLKEILYRRQEQLDFYSEELIEAAQADRHTRTYEQRLLLEQFEKNVAKGLTLKDAYEAAKKWIANQKDPFLGLYDAVKNYVRITSAEELVIEAWLDQQAIEEPTEEELASLDLEADLETTNEITDEIE